jgi:hypothetical protein
VIDDQITILIPTSPIPSHPSTAIIEKTIAAIRYHLPTARLIVMADGVREEVKHREAQYQEYKDRLQKKIDACAFGNAAMLVYSEHLHQARMTLETLRRVDTPLVYFNEHDVYLVTDHNPRDEENTGYTHPEDTIIRWDEIRDLILSGGSHFVRFYLWEKIWHEHQYLMCGQMIQGASKFIQTRQWSGWPHVASAAVYRNVLENYLHPNEKRMIELLIYGPVVESLWIDFRTTIYYPEPNARRFMHLNGRQDEATGVRDLADGGMDWR